MTNLAEPMGIFKMLRQRAASFAGRHPSMARRIMGLRPLGIASKSHLIEIDLGKGTRTVSTLDGAPPPVKRKPRKRKPIVVRPEPETTPPIPVIITAKVRSVAAIVAMVCKHFEISASDFYSPRRPQTLARVRFAAYALSRNLTTLSLPKIGRELGRKDHTTIMHGIARAGDLHANDAGWRTRYDAAAAELQA